MNDLLAARLDEIKARCRLLDMEAVELEKENVLLEDWHSAREGMKEFFRVATRTLVGRVLRRLKPDFAWQTIGSLVEQEVRRALTRLNQQVQEAFYEEEDTGSGS